MRTTAPKIKLPSKIDLIEIEKSKCQNGMKLYSFDACTEPVIILTIMLKAGRYFQAKEMLSGFTISLLKRGTKTMTANEIAEKLDFAGASLSFESGMFMVSVSLSCLKDKLEEVLPILTDILTECNFPEKEIALEKKNQIQNLKINYEKNNFIASITFNKAISGEYHPCGYAPNEKFINNITREDIIDFYENSFKLNKESYIVLAGDVDKKAISLIEKHIGNIPLKKFKNKHIPFEPIKEKEIFITKKDSVQSSIRIGMPFIEINHSDFIDFEIVNRLLGGFFGSRLMSNIREDKGYTYGIYSYISPFLGGSFFVIATDVGSQYKEATINEISFEINRLKKEAISKEELQMLKNYHKGRIMKSVDSALRYASVTNNYLSLGIEKDLTNDKLQAIENITPNRIMELANKYLDFDNMYKIVVG